MRSWGQTGIQNGSSVIIAQIITVYDWIMLLISFIVILVSYMMVCTIVNKRRDLLYFTNELLEFSWVRAPCAVLLFLAMPSLHCLYLMEESVNPFVTLKVIGHQWYWSYEYNDVNSLEFDSYILPYEGGYNFRLLEVDNEILLPLNVERRILVRRADVLHRWAIPALGIKMDAVPGRINMLTTLPKKVGNFYGQCSEMCGAIHRFMPIKLSVVPTSVFILWMTR